MEFFLDFRYFSIFSGISVLEVRGRTCYFIKGRLGLFGVVKNNTGKYHGGRDDPNQQLHLEKATS